MLMPLVLTDAESGSRVAVDPVDIESVFEDEDRSHVYFKGDRAPITVIQEFDEVIRSIKKGAWSYGE